MPLDGVQFPLTVAEKQRRTWGRNRRLSQGMRRIWNILVYRRAPLQLWAPGDVVVPSELLVVQILCAARATIELEETWIRGRYRTTGGRRHCAVGALRSAARLIRDPEAYAAARELLRTEASARGFNSIELMNDRSYHGQVLSAFDNAIAQARASLAE